MPVSRQTIQQLLRMERLDIRITSKIAAVKCQYSVYLMHMHGRDEPGIVNLRTRHAVSTIRARHAL
jgi:glycine cleavage system regulatory protein